MARVSTLTIRKEDGIADFEKHLRSNPSDRVLLLPSSIYNGGALGRSVGLAQLIFTWAQHADVPTARTYIASSDNARQNEKAYQKFVSRLHGLAAAYFSDAITTQDDKENIRIDLLRSARKRIRAMSEGNLRQTVKDVREVELILVHGARNQFHRVLYKSTPKLTDLMDREKHGELVADANDMSNLLWCFLDEDKSIGASTEREYLKRQLIMPRNPLGQLLYESFRNTAEHAYLDVRGNVPPKGMRSLAIGIHQVKRSDFNSSAVTSSDRPQVADYFDWLQKHRSYEKRKHIDVLEISVLDSGPGFAKTISRVCDSEGGSLDDVTQVARCFQKHQSAKSGRSSGIGLSRILQSVHDLGGFMRLRTSTTESFFAGSPAYSPEMNPLDFIHGALADVQGTSLTVVIPLVY